MLPIISSKIKTIHKFTSKDRKLVLKFNSGGITFHKRPVCIFIGVVIFSIIAYSVDWGNWLDEENMTLLLFEGYLYRKVTYVFMAVFVFILVYYYVSHATKRQISIESDLQEIIVCSPLKNREYHNQSDSASSPNSEGTSNSNVEIQTEIQINNAHPAKLFVRGLSPFTTSHELTQYFSRFGIVLHSQVVYEKGSLESRCFGFIAFDGATAMILALSEPIHILDDCILTIEEHYEHYDRNKKSETCLPQNNQTLKTNSAETRTKTNRESDHARPFKISVPNLSPAISANELGILFCQFGEVLDASISMDEDSGIYIGNVEFATQAGLFAALNAHSNGNIFGVAEEDTTWMMSLVPELMFFN